MSIFAYTVEPDYDPTRPDDWDNVAHIILDVPRYVDVNTSDIPTRELREASDPIEYLREHGALAITPVYAYCHSGVTIRAGESNPYGDVWDSGVAGFAFTTRERLDTMGVTDAMAETAVRQDVETWDQYLTGDVWTVSVVNLSTGETVESVCGCYGASYAETEGAAMLAHIEECERRALSYSWHD